ncbi:RecQ family ATP-dependent DNA helicase [Lacticaseibacillus hulanensis]|uniref:RecQ family ATP-dependent DNA helicase n=1 Tax=Lacticaseibacillus hulanensis TaxID=2493111 RepID=UPI000FD6DB69|nr:RecQ family ATP-dependent DNA helicase [Lacticaseibacillus hulanensis]
MDKRIQPVLAKFGLSSLRPGQADIIDAVLAGQDCLGVLPTGGGKTLCYQLPAAITGGLTVVVEPLLALMRDQVLRLQGLGAKRVVALNSTLAPDTVTGILQHLNQFNFLFIAPEMLQRPDVQAVLRRVRVQLMVVDEAHCIYQWGPDFRPAYLQLGQIRAAIQPRSVLALTATAAAPVQAEIIKDLRLSGPVTVNISVDRPNLFLGVEQLLTDGERKARLLQLLGQLDGDAVVYCPTRKQAEQLSETIQKKTGRTAAFYHADLDAHTRTLRERQFQAGTIQVMCATSAFGMGVDKPNIRVVVYLGVPQTLTDYFQAIGRAGRDGQFAVSALLYTPNDLVRAKQFADALPNQAVVDAVYANPAAYSRTADPQIELISSYEHLGFTKAQVVQQLTERLSVRADGVQQVADYLQTSGCYRAALMSSFDSSAREHDDTCCGVVAADLRTSAGEKVRKASEISGWRDVFKEIFMNKR